MENKSLLVIEDDAHIREGLRELLESEGYQVQLAGNGQLGLDRLAEIEQPDVILLDLMMPVMDGFEFIKNLEQKYPRLHSQVPIVLLTAAGDRAHKVTGVREIVKKPIDVDTLLNVLAKYAGAR